MDDLKLKALEDAVTELARQLDKVQLQLVDIEDELGCLGYDIEGLQGAIEAIEEQLA